MRTLRFAARPPSGGRCRSGERGFTRGFTLVELVIVMLLMAVVSAIGMSRFADREPFAVQGAADQLVSGLRLAQATAIAQRLPVFVVLTASPLALQVCMDAACTQPLAAPGGEAAWLADVQGLRLAGGAAFSYAASGAPSLASALTLVVQSSDGAVSSLPVLVEPGSGHVHSP